MGVKAVVQGFSNGVCGAGAGGNCAREGNEPLVGSIFRTVHQQFLLRSGGRDARPLAWERGESEDPVTEAVRFKLEGKAANERRG